VAGRLGRSEAARTYYEQALAIAREIGDRHSEGGSLMDLASLADAQGRLEAARTYYEQALAIFEAIGAEEEARSVREYLTTRMANSTQAVKPRRSWWPFGR
jgi:tetratricopeptide (TPR) repeat protein